MAGQMSTYLDISTEKMLIIQKIKQQNEIKKTMCVLDYTKQMGSQDPKSYLLFQKSSRSEVYEVVEKLSGA
jgi:hypothetical protein